MNKSNEGKSGKSDSLDDTTKSINGYCTNNNIGSVNERTALKTNFETTMDTISEMMKQLEIAPQSKSAITGSNSKKNYLFCNKLNERGKSVVETNKSIFNLSDLKEELSKELLQNGKSILSTANNTSSSFTGLLRNSKLTFSKNSFTSNTIPQNTQETSDSVSVFVFGDKNAQALILNPKSLGNAVSSIKNPNNKFSSEANSNMLIIDTIPQNTKGETIQVVPSNFKFVFNKSLVPISVTVPTSTLDTDSTHKDQNKKSTFNSTALISLFQDTWKLGRSTMETAVPTVTSPTVSSKPFRNIFTMSSILLSKKPLISQNKLLKNSSIPYIMYVDFKTVKPTFRTAKQNTDSIYIFGSKKNPESIFDQKSPCKTKSPFNKPKLMSLFAGEWIIGTSKTPKSSTIKSPEVTSPFRNKFVASATLISKKKLFPQDNTSRIEFKNFDPTASVEFKSVLPNFCSSNERGYFCSVQQSCTPVYAFGGPATLAPINISHSFTASEDKATSITRDTTKKLTLELDCTKHEKLGKSTSVFQQNKKSQLETRSTNGQRKIKLDLYKYEDYKSALAMFEDAIQLCPDNATFYVFASHYYSKLGNYDEAVNYAQKVVAADHTFTYGYIWLARCHIATGNVHLAEDAKANARVNELSGEDERSLLQEVERLIQLYRDIQRDISVKNFGHADSSANKFLTLCPSNRVKAIKAVCLTYQMELYRAMEITKKCLQTNSLEVEALYARGLCHYFNGALQKATVYFEQVLNIFPLHMGATDLLQKIKRFMTWEEEGKEALKAGDYNKVIMINNAMANDDKLNKKTNAKLFWNNAEMYSKLNNIPLAIEACTLALEQNVYSIPTLSRRAEYYKKIGKYKDALSDIEKCYEIDNIGYADLMSETKKEALEKEAVYNKTFMEVDCLIRNDKIMKALKVMDQSLPEYTCDAKVFYTKGLCFFCLEKYDEAVQHFQRALKIDPIHVESCEMLNRTISLKNNLELGRTALMDGQWSQALHHYNECLKCCIENKKLSVRLYCTTGRIWHVHLNTVHTAILAYGNALRLDDKCIEALSGRSKCFTAIGQHENALLDCEKLYAIDKSDETKELLQKALGASKIGQARIKFEAGQDLYKRNKFKDALVMYKEAIRLHPENAEYHSNSFSCHMKLEMFKEAFVDAKKAVVLYGKCNDTIRGIAKCFIYIGELSGAERAIVKASEAGEECMEERRALQTLQRLHAQAQKHIEEQDYQRAVSCMNQCLESSPFSSKVKLIKAESLAMLGKIDQAQEIADECLRFDHTDVEAVYIKGLCIYYQV
ncbi:uncharacterized protein LOC112048188 isoform X2 [Bicyclus anynana]|uniref:Uncharacterized protein LOC112048188 isoform X2 n=1 Tax=Bicyclus anynana TaxID=110368 RepID=A0ABM3LMB3_BICAN|nr:uncharacterized protein LOC112048188 isoform X2 [Bicyclus anynana]